MYRCHQAKMSQQALAGNGLSVLAEAVDWQLDLQTLTDGAGQNWS